MPRSLARLLATALSAAVLITPGVWADDIGTPPSVEPGEGTSVRLQDVPSYLQRLFLPVVPRTENTLEIATMRAEEVLEQPAGFDVRVKNGAIVVYATDEAESGGYARVRAGGRELQLTLVDVVPYERMKNGRLEGYRVGEYNARPLRGLEQYERPRGFIRLDGKFDSLRVSDHYVMRDFQCKLDGSTRFLILRTDALLKLEILQHELERQHGLKFSRFTIMSGYRTPYYNSKIGNETGYSRHLYGDAMDIYVDEDRNGSMDDVNRDGRVDAGDARFLLRVAEQIDRSERWGWLKGGAGVYHANSAHGPYLHVDARGYVARWGAIEEKSGRSGTKTAAR